MECRVDFLACTKGAGAGRIERAPARAHSSAAITVAGRSSGEISRETVTPCNACGGLVLVIFAFAAAAWGTMVTLPCELSRCVALQFISITLPSTPSIEIQSPTRYGSVELRTIPAKTSCKVL